VKEKLARALPYVFLLLAALSRWPGLMPQNFSVVYGLAFCAGAFFPRAVRWWMPLGMLLLTDVALNIYYHQPPRLYQVANYLAYGSIILFGTKFNRKSSFTNLLLGGVFGAFLFYLITNTAAWLFNPFGNPEYTKDLAGLLTALTKGTGGWPTTIEFFINTLLSGGLFTGLFAGAMKLTDTAESAKEKEPKEAPAQESEPDTVPAPAAEEA
jgi:hypothetical protein